MEGDEGGQETFSRGTILAPRPSVTFISRCKSVRHGWRLLQRYSRSLRSLRVAEQAFGLPLHRLSAEEVDATLDNFVWLARVRGLPREDLEPIIRDIRAAAVAARATQAASSDQRVMRARTT